MPEVVIHTAFVSERYNDRLVVMFNPRLFQRDFAISIDKETREILGAETTNFLIFRRHLSQNTYRQEKWKILQRFDVYSKHDGKSVGFVNIEFDDLVDCIKLNFFIDADVFYTRFALEIFSHFMIMIVHMRKNSPKEIRLCCNLNQHLARVEDPILKGTIVQVFELLSFKQNYGRLHTVWLKEFKDALASNRLLLDEAKMSKANQNYVKQQNNISPMGSIASTGFTRCKRDRENDNTYEAHQQNNITMQSPPRKKKFLI